MAAVRPDKYSLEDEELDATIADIEADLLGKQDTLVSGVNIKTINSNSLLGSGDLVISGGGGGAVATDVIWDAKGDLVAGTGADAATKLTAGANDSFLVPDSAVANGMKWIAAAAVRAILNVANGATANDTDANLKNRTNHTGTQSADTLTDGATNKAFLATERTKLAGISSGATANSSDATLLARVNHTGTQSADTLTDGTTNKAFLATERTKLTGIATGATANDTDANLKNRANHTGSQSADTLTDGTTNKAFLATERTKLAGIATGATANSSDATLLARANHTGSQLASTISDFAATVRSTLLTGLSLASATAIAATDTVLQALGQLQKQISDLVSGTTAAGKATVLATARNIGGVSFNGSADITVATATGGFTVSGGNLAVGTNQIVMTSNTQGLLMNSVGSTKFYSTNVDANSDDTYLESTKNYHALRIIAASSIFRILAFSPGTGYFQCGQSAGSPNGSLIFSGLNGNDAANVQFQATEGWIKGKFAVGQMAGPSATLHVKAAALNDEVHRIETTSASGSLPSERVFQNRGTTTDATVTTLQNVTLPASTTMMVEAYVTARRTGGASGTAEDGAAYIIRAAFKNVAGTATLIGAVNVDFSAESVAGYDATLDASGGNIRVRVTGAATTNITWNTTTRVWQVST